MACPFVDCTRHTAQSYLQVTPGRPPGPGSSLAVRRAVRRSGSADRDRDGLLAVQLGRAPAVPRDHAAIRMVRLSERFELLRRRHADAPGQAVTTANA